MSNKSKFLKSAILAIAGLALISGLSSCKMIGCRHNCASKEVTKEEKSKDSSKPKKEGKAAKSKESKAKASPKKEEEKKAE
jgi:hypothetical protein